MSQLIVEITKVLEINEHPAADRLELVTIKGWSVVVQKDILHVDDLVIFIPPDSVLPASLHEYLGITKYCAALPKSFNTDARRVKAARLRGAVSYGTIMTLASFKDYQIQKLGYSTQYPENTNMKDILGITKWEPPVKSTQGDVLRDNIDFPKYTSIEHWGNYPDVIKEDEQVVITEKIHGTSNRLGIILDENEKGIKSPILVAGSHNTRRKRYDKNDNECLYWMPFTKYPLLKKMLSDLFNIYQKPVIVYGEIYGDGIQDMTYEGGKNFRIFDIMIDGKYIMWDNVIALCNQYEVPCVPTIYKGTYNKDKVRELTDGPCVICENPGGKFKGREGIVIKPLVDRDDPLIGRVILKSVSADYLGRS